jgi:glycosyltransferase involved in cell wall biosynthesis
MNELRVAWLVPTAWFYWQPSLSELTKLFPQTKVFTGLFPGFAKGFEGSLEVEVVGERKVIAVIQSKTSYGDNFTYLSPKIISHLFSYKPDVIFSSSFGVWSILALVFKFFGGWRVILAYEGSSPGVDYRGSKLRLLLRRIMVCLADACITNSHAGKDYLVNILNASSERVFVHPYEVPDARSLASINEDLELISQNSNLKFSDLQRPTFLFVGNIVSRKGVRCLLEACKTLKKSGNNHFTVLIVGDGEQRLELQELSSAYQLEGCVIWIGRVEYDNISTYFHRADVFVLPTFEDTWGMVVLEAMLLGKPILCSRDAGASELVQDGENGYCFDPNNSDDLALVMQKLIDNPSCIQFMGQRSTDIMTQYTPQTAAEFMSKMVTLVSRS